MCLLGSRSLPRSSRAYKETAIHNQQEPWRAAICRQLRSAAVGHFSTGVSSVGGCEWVFQAAHNGSRCPRLARGVADACFVRRTSLSVERSGIVVSTDEDVRGTEKRVHPKHRVRC